MSKPPELVKVVMVSEGRMTRRMGRHVEYISDAILHVTSVDVVRALHVWDCHHGET